VNYLLKNYELLIQEYIVNSIR